MSGISPKLYLAPPKINSTLLPPIQREMLINSLSLCCRNAVMYSTRQGMEDRLYHSIDGLHKSYSKRMANTNSGQNILYCTVMSEVQEKYCREPC